MFVPCIHIKCTYALIEKS
uniref:Uncharacterized protein n=1 Tax=Lepeophtheirus salmonis TaxID=72036 RepID=A0A0K2T451_LEPSM